MFVELIEALRCPRAHEESALVASASRSEARYIVDGVLGCPVCGAEFVIANGVTHFDDPLRPTPDTTPSAEEAMRLAAFLELTDPHGFALLCGEWGSHAKPLKQLSETPVVLVNPAPAVSVEVAGIVELRDVFPFAEHSARGAALPGGAPAAFTASAVRAVRSGGRIIGPTPLPMPAGVRELARDERSWVGEKVGPTYTIAVSRSS